jgi:hypothetical protein
MTGMGRKEFIGFAAAAAGALAGEPEAAARQSSRAGRSPFSLRGVYFHDGFTAGYSDGAKSQAPLYWNLDNWRKQLDWLGACGINAVEFATMLEFNRVPSTPLERTKIADRLKVLKHAHALGMKFGYLLSNTVVSTVPPNEEPGHQEQNRAKTLCPRVPGNFEKTVAIPKFYMETYRDADFFEEFAADWGGCDCGECGVPEYLRYVRALAERLAELHPEAKLYADTWCISFWRKEPMAQGWRGMFEQEIAGSRSVIDALAGLPSNVGLALPCHHLYRPLAFEAYGGKAKTPVFPTRDDVTRVRRMARDVLAWPHFVIDDDAYRPKSWGIVHSEVRYIQALLRSLHAAGVEQVIGNLYLPHLQLSNTFAYGRLLRDPDLSPHAILEEFARLVARPGDAEKLTDVLAWVENNSFWHRQMPEDARLPALPCGLTRTDALRLAGEVRPNSGSHPLPIPPADWLADLRRSIARMDWAEG